MRSIEEVLALVREPDEIRGEERIWNGGTRICPRVFGGWWAFAHDLQTGLSDYLIFETTDLLHAAFSDKEFRKRYGLCHPPAPAKATPDALRVADILALVRTPDTYSAVPAGTGLDYRCEWVGTSPKSGGRSLGLRSNRYRSNHYYHQWILFRYDHFPTHYTPEEIIAFFSDPVFCERYSLDRLPEENAGQVACGENRSIPAVSRELLELARSTRAPDPPMLLPFDPEKWAAAICIIANGEMEEVYKRVVTALREAYSLGVREDHTAGDAKKVAQFQDSCKPATAADARPPARDWRTVLHGPYVPPA